jgi:MFS family permease
MISWSVAQIIYSWLSSMIVNWRFICIGVIGIPFLISIYFSRKYLLETPRWLVSKKRFQEAKEILSKISIINDRSQVGFLLEGEDKSIFDYQSTTAGNNKSNLLEK